MKKTSKTMIKMRNKMTKKTVLDRKRNKTAENRGVKAVQ